MVPKVRKAHGEVTKCLSVLEQDSRMLLPLNNLGSCFSESYQHWICLLLDNILFPFFFFSITFS